MSGWNPFPKPPAHFVGTALYSTDAPGWPRSPESSEEQIDELLEQQDDLQQFVRERRRYEELPDTVWQALGELTQQMQELRVQFQSQQREIATLKQAQGVRLDERAALEPDPVQRWKAAHREVLEAHRGKHVAIDPESGIVAAAESYGLLLEELERQEWADDRTVIEFIPSYFRAK